MVRAIKGLHEPSLQCSILAVSVSVSALAAIFEESFVRYYHKGNWVTGAQALSVLFPKIARVSVIISTLKKCKYWG